MWLLIAVLALMIPILGMLLDSPVVRALAARIERGDRLGAGPPTDDARVSALETEVDRLSREVTKLQEQSDFMSRLLEERTPPPSLPPGREPGGPGVGGS